MGGIPSSVPNLVHLPQTIGESSILCVKGSEGLPSGTRKIKRINELDYDTDWNSLMPVVDKCFEVTNQQELLDEVCLGEGLMVDIMHHLQTAYRRGTYDAVVEFIKAHTQTHIHPQTHTQ